MRYNHHFGNYKSHYVPEKEMVIIMTEKLYYKDSHMKDFTAKVLSCEKGKDCFEVVLDKTAFFPEGGGQLADTGFIGKVRVLGVQEKNGEIIHYVNQAIAPDTKVKCTLDWEQRFRRMQNHSGEHIVSGLVHNKYGYSNIGFHMGHDAVTIDFDGELSYEQLSEIEKEANFAVAANHRIITAFPSEEELKAMEYRSKLELTENVRIVTIEGVDVCACCAPHVSSTSEVGIIKILDSERRRRGGEGTRVTMLCGLDAFDDYVVKQDNAALISMLLSAKQNETALAVRRVLAERERQKNRIFELSRELSKFRADALEETEGNICIFDDVLDEPALRDIVNAAVNKCGGIAAVFSGNDESGYRYIIGSRTVDLRAKAAEINKAICGRGGGKSEMIQGSCTLDAKSISDYVAKFDI